MKKMVFVALLAVSAAGSASARDVGIINQAGPYEATMHFYLHPAHGFPGAPEPAPVSVAKSQGAKTEPASIASTRAPVADNHRDGTESASIASVRGAALRIREGAEAPATRKRGS